ncbi:Exodeoxyribonuclease VII large subunit [hydrothermal vent metagenome]|uniref:Exodeoxyribonuclease VII large subunit n=1 Tax=hydrothermal vent metagenome TaxID=652676 RepID=A0A1W1DAH1_9ZZZZ
MPTEVNTIGVISSSNGAVIRDIIKVLNKRYPFAEVLLFDTVVQGEGSAEKIAYAIAAADQSKQCDVLIVARGGGSLEDLWAFNEEVLARAIFAAKTPIISAVGHETDTTIADFVADIRAPTPSAAAMLATPDRLELLNKLNKLNNNLTRLSQQVLERYQSQLQQLSLSTPNLTRQLNLFAQRLDGLNTHLNYQMKSLVSLNQSKISTLFEQLKQYSPSAKISHNQQLNYLAKTQLKQSIQRLVIQHKNTLNGLHERLEKSINNTLDWQKNKLSQHALGLNHLSPLNTLSRGYSISTMQDNQVLHSTADVKIGEKMTTLLSDGKIYSQVKKIEKT